jgi:hypothetical protein
MGQPNEQDGVQYGSREVERDRDRCNAQLAERSQAAPHSLVDREVEIPGEPRRRSPKGQRSQHQPGGRGAVLDMRRDHSSGSSRHNVDEEDQAHGQSASVHAR